MAAHLRTCIRNPMRAFLSVSHSHVPVSRCVISSCVFTPHLRDSYLLGNYSLNLIACDTEKCENSRRFAQITPCRRNYYNMPYTIVERGTTNTTDYRIYFKNADNGAYVSAFHDIPLSESAGLFNMIVEIPRWTNEKMEISRDEPLNPIKQDIKKGNLRFVPNVFPHHGYIWNYGALPQTWENPELKDEHTGFNGDNDPIDALEIGSRIAKRGEVLQVKILGAIALIDEGETDWKIVTINKNDPLFEVLKDITDVEKHLPGLLKATVEWLRIYKIPDGKPENQFAFNSEFKDKAFATKIVQDTHAHWKGLITRDEAKINLMNTTLNDEKNTVAAQEAEQIVKSTPQHAVGSCPDDSVGKWHFIQLK